MQVSFIGFQPIRSSEHMASMFVFVLMQLYIFFGWIKEKLSEQQFKKLYQRGIVFVIILGISIIVVLTITGKISPWTGRFYALLDPTYAKSHIPIIASVSAVLGVLIVILFLSIIIAIIIQMKKEKKRPEEKIHLIARNCHKQDLFGGRYYFCLVLAFYS